MAAAVGTNKESVSYEPLSTDDQPAGLFRLAHREVSVLSCWYEK